MFGKVAGWALSLYRFVQDIEFVFVVLGAVGVGAISIGSFGTSTSAIFLAVGLALVSLPFFLPLTAWALSLARLSDQPAKATTPAVPFAEIRNCYLNYREHCGVRWRAQVKSDGSVVIGGPYCPEDTEELKYRNELTDLDRRLARLKRSEAQPFSTAVFGQPPGSAPQAEGSNEEQEFEIRDLSGKDPSRGKSGPYCERCSTLRPMPKTVDECRLEVLQDVLRMLGLGS